MSKTINRPITRETPDRDPIKNETIMVKLEPGSKMLILWQKGRRSRLKVRYADIYRLGYQNLARSAINSKMERWWKKRDKKPV
jgi:hypothetical protein